MTPEQLRELVFRDLAVNVLAGDWISVLLLLIALAAVVVVVVAVIEETK